MYIVYIYEKCSVQHLLQDILEFRSACHSSEIRSIYFMKCGSGMLHNVPYFSVVFHSLFRTNIFFS